MNSNSNIDDRFLCCYCCYAVFLHSSNKIQKPQITVVVVLLRKYAWIWFVSHKSPHVLMLLNFCHQIRIWQTSFSFACLLWIIVVVVVFVVVYAATSPKRTFFSTNFLHLYNFRRVIFGLFIVDVVVCLITHTLVLPPAPNWQCCGILQPILASHSTDWKLILWVCVSRSVYTFFGLCLVYEHTCIVSCVWECIVLLTLCMKRTHIYTCTQATC